MVTFTPRLLYPHGWEAVWVPKPVSVVQPPLTEILAGAVACAYIIWVEGPPPGKLAHERPKGRWKNKFQMDAQCIDREDCVPVISDYISSTDMLINE